MKHLKTFFSDWGWQQFTVEKNQKGFGFRIGSVKSGLQLRKILDQSKLNRPKVFKTYLF